MTPAELAADLAALGITVKVVKGLPALAPGPGGWPGWFAGSELLRAATENRNAVLAAMGHSAEACPLCCRRVCPAGGRVPDCDRAPVRSVRLDAAGVFARDDAPRCPFKGDADA